MRVTFQMTLEGWYVRDPLWLIEVTTSALWNVSSLDSQCIGEEFELQRLSYLLLMYFCTVLLYFCTAAAAAAVLHRHFSMIVISLTHI